MNAPHRTTRRRVHRRVLPGATATAVALGSLALLSGSAHAASGDPTYSCTFGSLLSGAQSTTVTIDTDAPDTTPVNGPLDITTTATINVPEAVQTALKALSPSAIELVATDPDGVKELYVSGATTIPVTTHPSFHFAQSGWSFTGSSPAPNHIEPGPSVPGTYQVKAADIDLDLNVYTGTSTPTTYDMSCTPPSGNPLIDTMTVTAPTSTSLTLASSTWTKPAAGPSATATVTVPGTTSNWPALTGSVQLYDGSTKLGSPGVLSDGKATFAHLPDLPLGGHSITAAYVPPSGGAYLASTSTASSLAVDTTTTTEVSVEPQDPVTNTSAVATATVKAGDGSTPSGSVAFKVDGQSVGTATLNGAGVATTDLPTDALGDHALTATYAGTADFETSTSDTTYTVVAVPPATTTTSLTLSGHAAAYGARTTATAKVTSATGTPTGKMRFRFGAKVLTAVVRNGVASVTAPVLAPGRYAVTATFTATDDTLFASSSSASRTLVVTKDSTRATSTVRGVRLHQRPTTTVTIHTAHGSVATGRIIVQLKRWGMVKQTRTIALEQGKATATFWKIGRPGKWAIVVRYAGNDRLSRSSLIKTARLKPAKRAAHKKAGRH